jgi:hypothetical protein
MLCKICAWVADNFSDFFAGPPVYQKHSGHGAKISGQNKGEKQALYCIAFEV